MHYQRWKVNKYIYSSIDLSICAFYIFCYFIVYSTTVQSKILYFLLNYIYLASLVTSYFIDSGCYYKI